MILVQETCRLFGYRDDPQSFPGTANLLAVKMLVMFVRDIGQDFLFSQSRTINEPVGLRMQWVQLPL
jgi:hypothetical protein